MGWNASSVAFKVLLLLKLFSLPSTASSKTLLPSEWQGENLNSKESVALIRIRLLGFSKKLQNKHDITVHLFSLIDRFTYVFKHPTNEASADLPLWKLRAGKYRVASLSLIDSKGKKWFVKTNQNVLIKPKVLTNLGIWNLKKGKKKSLRIKIQGRAPVKNLGKKNLPFAAIINGYNGLVEKYLRKPKQLVAKTNEERIEYSYKKATGMYFKLNLFRHNAYAPRIAAVLNHEDPSLRTCYTNSLEDNPKLQGELVFRFIMAKKIKGIQKLKLKKSNIQDAKLIECLYYKLLAVDFPIRENMIGELTYTFQIKYTK